MDTLLEDEVSPSPIEQFRRWFDDALALNRPESNAMALATVDATGAPSARMVLLKEFDESGFVFYTNYRSRKAAELEENARVALVLFWVELHRQIRIEGRVEKIDAERSDAYFASRARGSQIAATASPQSSPLSNREQLERRVAEVEARYAGTNVPRPEWWGGYLVVPEVIEFWQGRPNRLHDRLRYQREESGVWSIVRLAP